jgi:plasmid stabilization system protein ParE
VTKIVWTRQARSVLNDILDYRYSEIPEARKIVKTDIISASLNIIFPEQFQKDDIFPEYRRIIVRDYKILYSFKESIVFNECGLYKSFKYY